MKFQVDVSRTYRNKEGYDAGGYKLNTSFVTETHTPESFIETVVKEGWPYTMVHNHDRWPAETGADSRNVKTPKHTENFISRQELTGDDDSQAPGVVDFWLNDPFFSRYGFAFVESVNSRPEAEKGHPTFIFDRPISDPRLYKEAAKAFIWHYAPLRPVHIVDGEEKTLDRSIHNLDRTIYNAVGARVHLVGHVCPFDVFEAEIIQPYRAHQARQAEQAEQAHRARQAELEKALSEGRVTRDRGILGRYLAATLDGIVRWLGAQAHGRHPALYWTGRKVGELEAAAWAAPFGDLFADIESRVLQATSANGYFEKYARRNEAEVLRTFNDGRTFGGLSPAEEPVLIRPAAPKTSARQQGIEVRKQAALLVAAARRAEREAQQAEREAELDRRHQAGDVLPFVGDEVPDPDYLEWKRAQFSNSQKWADYCRALWPDIDAEEQRRIKLAENREAKPHKCGEYRKKVLPNGEVHTTRWTCGVCDDCIKRGVWTLRRALCEIQGIVPDRPTGPRASLEALEAADLEAPSAEAPRENAPPLSVVHGDLSLVTIEGDKERLKFARDLRRGGVAYRCQPIVVAGGVVFDFITNDNQGEPLGLALTDERLKLWVKGAENKRASGDLLPSLKKLQQRYREALPFEVVMPELDDDGQPVDEDIFYLELPDIGTKAKLPGVVIDFEVKDAETLQAAILVIHAEQWRILGRRGDVNYGVCIHKKFYTRYSTLPALIESFNASQALLRAAKQQKE